MPKDKYGNELTWSEWRERFKEGVDAITPLQQVKVSLMGNIIVVVGVIIGIITTFISGTWWLLIILFGSFFITSVALLGTWQKYNGLVKINKAMEDLKDEQESTNGI